MCISHCAHSLKARVRAQQQQRAHPKLKPNLNSNCCCCCCCSNNRQIFVFNTLCFLLLVCVNSDFNTAKAEQQQQHENARNFSHTAHTKQQHKLCCCSHIVQCDARDLWRHKQTRTLCVLRANNTHTVDCVLIDNFIETVTHQQQQQ